MDDSLARKINSANSILLVIPTDIDFAMIYAGIAMGQAIKNKPVTILNDAVTTNKLLIYKLKNFRFNALHTRATRSFTLIINKLANRIKQTFIDESDEKINLCFETETGDFDPKSFIELKQSKIDQDLIIILNSKESPMPNKYAMAVGKQAEEKIVNFTSNKFWADTVLSSFDRFSFNEFSLTLRLASLMTETRFLRSNVTAETLDLMKQLISLGADYNDAFNVATAYINGEEAGFSGSEMLNAKNMGDGIYFSHVIDTDNLYPIKPPYLPLIAYFADCKICFTIITKKNFNTVFIVNKKDRFSLNLIRQQYGGIGDNNYLYFKSEVEAKELEQDLMRKIITITNGSTGISQVSAALESEEEETQRTLKFTQGLEKPDPLGPAPFIPPVVNPITPTAKPNNGNGSPVRVAEEC